MKGHTIALFCLLVCLALGGMACRQAAEIDVAPTVTATNLPPTATQVPTIAATNTSVPLPQVSVVTQPPPATPTAIPTALLATPTKIGDATLPAPDATAIPTEAVVSAEAETVVEPTQEVAAVPVEGGCRSREELAGIRQSYVLGVDSWTKPTANPNELHVGLGGGDLKLIHLGFDVEGSPDPLGEMLDVLEARGVQTTMFIVGSWAETYPDRIKEMAARGHEFANHTLSHGNMKDMSAEMVQDELKRTEAIVQRLTGQSTKPYLRPPFGSRSVESVQAAYDVGWTTVIWSGSTEDWRVDATEESMCKTLLEGGRPGGILYSHSWHPAMPAVIDRFIGEMQSQGYTFVPLSVMMSGQAQSYLVQQ